MNYGEEIAYWYLRLNGFFPISNFVIHKSSNIERTCECDLLAIRPPHVYEEIGGKAEDWDANLFSKLEFDKKNIGIICEVKTGRYKIEKIFSQKYLEYSLGRLGLLPFDQISKIKDDLMVHPIVDLSPTHRICKLLIANGPSRPGPFEFLSLSAAEEFIENRVRRYPREKYSGRMFFGSALFQHTIDRITREKK